MKTIEISLYKFSELSEQAKQHAIEKHCYINVDFDWWDFVYSDAEDVGLKIIGFDIDRGNYCQLEYIFGAKDVAKEIIKNHGEICDTYKLSNEFLREICELEQKMNSCNETELYDIEKDIDFIKDEFLTNLSECYLSMLRDEYEFRISQDAIIEVLEINDYDFTEDGEIY